MDGSRSWLPGGPGTLRATDVIRREHLTIERGLVVLEGIAALADSQVAAVGELAGAIHRFLRVFADGAHQAKEDLVLFPILLPKGLSPRDAFVARFRDDHHRLMQVGEGLGDRIQALGQTALAGAGFAEAARSYVAIRRTHIRVESQYLLPIADRLVTPAEDLQIVLGFRRLEARMLPTAENERLMGELAALEVDVASRADGELRAG